jgi:hypothetical protein
MNGTEKDAERSKEYFSEKERAAEIVAELRKSLQRFIVTRSKGGWTPEQCESMSLVGLLVAAKTYAHREEGVEPW